MTVLEPERIFAIASETCRQNFTRRSFTLDHRLCGHELFSLDRLALAAERALSSMPGEQLFASAGDQGTLDSNFAEMGERKSSPEIISNLSGARAWSKLSKINVFDSDYADLLEDILADFYVISELPPESVSDASLTVFLTSPRVVTPFHIDHEANILCQISGDAKTLCVFPPDDREVVSLGQIESFYVNDINAAKYRPVIQSHGVEYVLTAGTALHIPPLAAHWAKNGDDISISLSLSLCMHELEKRARVHQVNYHLRKIGLQPKEPGDSFFDNAKAGILSIFSKRHPQTYNERVFSAVQRLRSPGRFARQALRKFAR
ncbi:cupin-like domain-containing protein [Novosphingobium malaysiense]|uniref:cupin-like domain-containing protein n=1 Tax=Novosphingobium malaysiense TaxID=1348853 RepID=UPI0006897A1E|nr:cupin-like domain-containing protein [Novosphingobium malaysiense]